MRQVYFIEELDGNHVARHVEVQLNKTSIIGHVLNYFQHAWVPSNLMQFIDDEAEPYWTAAVWDVLENAKWVKTRERMLLLAQFSPQIVNTGRLCLALKLVMPANMPEQLILRANGVVGEPQHFTNLRVNRDWQTLSEMFPNQRHSLDV